MKVLSPGRFLPESMLKRASSDETVREPIGHGQVSEAVIQGDFLLARFESCATQNAVLWYCDRSEGLDCRHEPALDESCTAGTPKPPNYTFCRYDVTPADCVPYTGTVGDSPPTAWCCP